MTPPQDPWIEELTQVRVTMRLRVADATAEGGAWTRDVPASSFETSERGIGLGLLFIPWHRVIEYRQILRDGSAPELAEDGSRAKMRVRVNDGSREGATHTVGADQFAVEPWGLALLLDRRIEPENGTTVTEKLHVPWHRVLEYERIIAVSDPEPPLRPDVEEPAEA